MTLSAWRLAFLPEHILLLLDLAVPVWTIASRFCLPIAFERGHQQVRKGYLKDTVVLNLCHFILGFFLPLPEFILGLNSTCAVLADSNFVLLDSGV